MEIFQAKSRLPVLSLSLIGILLVAGCTASQLDLAIKASPAAQGFLSQYPNAKVTTNLVSQGTVTAQLLEIKKDCQDFPVSSYYKTTINDEASGTKLTVWMDAKNYQVVCAVRETQGVKTPVANAPTTSTALPPTTTAQATTTTSFAPSTTQAATTTLAATTTTGVVTTTTSCTTPTTEIKLSFWAPPAYLNVDGSKHKIVSIGSTSATTAVLKIDDGSETTYTKGISYNAGTPSFSFKFINTTYGTYQTGDNQKDKVTLQISGSCNAVVCPIYKNVLGFRSPKTVAVGNRNHTIEMIAVVNSTGAFLKIDGVESSYLQNSVSTAGNPLINIMLANVTMPSQTGNAPQSSAELWIFEDTC